MKEKNENLSRTDLVPTQEMNENLLKTENFISIEQLEERLEMEACCSGCASGNSTTVVIKK